jgi:predicted enzyme related to lactoylglutathione lyase
MRLRLQELVIDCAEPAILAQFWAQVLGARWGVVDEGWAVVDAEPLMLAFQRVPEPKQSPKNRLHLDVQATDAAAAVERAEALGAHRTGHAELGADGDGYVVLQDPEGNEFCFVVDQGGGWAEVLRTALDAGAPAG